MDCCLFAAGSAAIREQELSQHSYVDIYVDFEVHDIRDFSICPINELDAIVL